MSHSSSYSFPSDLAKVIAIVGVVLIHTTDDFIFSKAFPQGTTFWILTFLNSLSRVAVPLFLMVSGYLLLDTARQMYNPVFLKRRLNRIIIPFVTWLTIYFVHLALISPDMSWETVLYSLLGLRVDHYYFLAIIIGLYFFGPVFYAFFKHTGRKTQLFYLVSGFVLSTLILFLNKVFPPVEVNWYRNIFTVFIPYIPYFGVGTYLRDVRLPKIAPVVLIPVMLICASIGTLLFMTDWRLYARDYLSPHIIIMSLSAFVLLFNRDGLVRNIKNQQFISLIRHLSPTVFGIYLLHLLIQHYVNKFWWVNPETVTSPLLLWILLKAVIIFFLSYLIVFIGRKIPGVRLIFG